MGSIADVRASLAADLSAQGFTVATDPLGIVPQAAVVGPITTVVLAGQCDYDTETLCYLVAPAPGGAAAMTWLEANLAAFLTALRPASEVTLGTLSTPAGDLPAYTATITRNTSEV